MNRVESGDRTEIAYRVAGAGRPLVLVHGAAADHIQERRGSMSSTSPYPDGFRASLFRHYG